MSNPQINISYNGHRTAVTLLPDNTFMVQITSKPYYIQKVENEDKTNFWVEVESGRETKLSDEVGKLIEGQQNLV